MRVAYIAGKYRSKTNAGVSINIQRAATVSLRYWKKGFAVICPHKNTGFFTGCPDEVWLKGDLEILSRLSPEKGDVLVAINGWENSKGAVAEVEYAKSLGLEVIVDDGK